MFPNEFKEGLKTALIILLTLVICVLHHITAWGSFLIREYVYSDVDPFALILCLALTAAVLTLTVIHRKSWYYQRIVSDNILRAYSLYMIVRIVIVCINTGWEDTLKQLAFVDGIVQALEWAVIPAAMIVISFIAPDRKYRKSQER